MGTQRSRNVHLVTGIAFQSGVSSWRRRFVVQFVFFFVSRWKTSRGVEYFAACLRRASWATDDSRRHDEDFSTDHGRICHDQLSKKVGVSHSHRLIRKSARSAPSVWSNAVTSCLVWRRCRRVQSDFTSSATQDTCHARERFVKTCVAGS